ncbi:MAG: protein kinase [Candidatus Riflebacteria bacterium]|nr:protein kinase [Candidatus Riflebacteria bacterium]
MIGKKIKDKYEIKGVIAESHTYEIFSAIELETGTPVVLKMMREEMAENVELVKIFSQEVTAFAKLNHKNIVHVLDMDSSNDRPFVVTEKVNGVDILKLSRSEVLPFVFCLKAVQSIGTLFQQALSENLEQRSIKLSNILRDDKGTLKILSFSFPRLKLIEKSQSLDPSSGIQSDIFFLGSTLFEILSGEPPIRRRGGLNECWDDILRKALRMRHQQLPPEEIEKVVDLIERSFTRNLKRRFADHAAFLMKVADLIAIGEKLDRSSKNQDREKRQMSACEVVDAIHGRRVPNVSSDKIETELTAIHASQMVKPSIKVAKPSNNVISINKSVSNPQLKTANGGADLGGLTIGLAPNRATKKSSATVPRNSDEFQVTGNLALNLENQNPLPDTENNVEDENDEPAVFARPIFQLIEGGRKAAKSVFWHASEEPNWYRNPLVITGAGIFFLIFLIFFW